MARLRAVAAIALVIVAAGACAARTAVSSRMRTFYCAALEDDPAGSQREQRLKSLHAEGTRARTALVGIAADPHDPLRACAFELLTDLRDPRVLPMLRNAAADPAETMSVRVSAIGDLASWRDVESLGTIRAALRSRADQELTLAAIGALGLIDHGDARLALREALAAREYAEFRIYILRALRQQGDRAAVQSVRSVAVDALRLEHPTLLQEIVLFLAGFGSADDQEFAVQLLEQMRDPERRRDVATHLIPRFEQLAATADPKERARMSALVARLKALTEAKMGRYLTKTFGISTSGSPLRNNLQRRGQRLRHARVAEAMPSSKRESQRSSSTRSSSTGIVTDHFRANFNTSATRTSFRTSRINGLALFSKPQQRPLNGTGPSSEIDSARETPHSSHGEDEGLGAMADGPS